MRGGDPPVVVTPVALVHQVGESRLVQPTVGAHPVASNDAQSSARLAMHVHRSSSSTPNPLRGDRSGVGTLPLALLVRVMFFFWRLDLRVHEAEQWTRLAGRPKGKGAIGCGEILSLPSANNQART